MSSDSIARTIRKAVVELVPTLAIVVLDYVALHNTELGIGASVLFVLLQVRRIIRDATMGIPE